MIRKEMRRTRVAIRTPERSDRGEFTSLMRPSHEIHRPWLRAPATTEAFRKYLKWVANERNEGFLICHLDSGGIVGVVNMGQIAWGAFRSAYLSYYVGRRYAGQGLMTEGLQLVLRHAFTRMKLHRLEANIQPGNHRSIGLVRRCGFVKEGYSRRYLKIGGRWRDHERWALLAEDWRASRRRPRK